MNVRHRKCVAVAISAGIALTLASTAAGAQPYDDSTVSAWGQQWQPYQQPVPYPWAGYRSPGFPFARPPWAGSNLSATPPVRGTGWGRASSNLQDKGDHYQFQLSIPGVDPNDLNIRVEGRVVRVSVVSGTSQGSQQQGEWRSFHSNYRKVFTLPQPVDSSRMESQYEEGVLTVTLPKLKAGG